MLEKELPLEFQECIDRRGGRGVRSLNQNKNHDSKVIGPLNPPITIFFLQLHPSTIEFGL
jgi:hypothetical protein